MVSLTSQLASYAGSSKGDNLSPRAYPVAIVSMVVPNLWAIPTRYSPVCHCPLPKSFSFDLHVLGLPPAFVLSQDQTLKFDSVISYYKRSISYDGALEFPLLYTQSDKSAQA